MMRRIIPVFVGLVFLVGCIGGVKEEQIEVKSENDPLNYPRSVLERYARGEPLSSEVTSFPKMVEDVKTVDPKRGALLEKGLADIQKSPSSRASIAKDLLKKLAPTQKPNESGS